MTTTEAEKGFEEIRELFKETDKKFRETEQRIKDLSNLFTGQWGKLIESLAESGIAELLQKRGIKISQLASRIQNRKNGRELELDFLLTNDTELVVGEVKTTMRVDDVREFLAELYQFQKFFPVYKDFKIYGAMIGIKIEEKADVFAYRNGLFVFKVGGEGTLRMLNDEKFQPTDFRQS